MLGEKTRAIFSEKVFDPIGKIIGKTGVHPNTITAMAIPLALASTYFLAVHDWILALVFLGLASFIDNIDGAVARTMHRKTDFGNYFDTMIDKYVEMIFFIGFGFAGYPLLALIAAATTMLESYAKPRVALVVEIDNHDWPAIGERAERLLIQISGVFAMVFVTSIDFVGMTFDPIQAALALVIAVTLIGGLQRIYYGKKLIDNPGLRHRDKYGD